MSAPAEMQVAHRQATGMEGEAMKGTLLMLLALGLVGIGAAGEEGEPGGIMPMLGVREGAGDHEQQVLANGASSVGNQTMKERLTALLRSGTT